MTAEDFCSCDNHGTCGTYNASRFSVDEVEQHKTWPALFNSELQQLNNVTVCYCSSTWTGYSDLGTFQEKGLMNCAINKKGLAGMWFIVILLFSFSATNVIRGCYRRGTIAQNIPRLISLVAYSIVGIMKVIYANEPRLATVGYSPWTTIMFLISHSFLMYNISDKQHQQSSRYYSKIFKDFGFGDRIDTEQLYIVRGVQIQRLTTTIGSVFFGISTAQDSYTVHSVALVSLFGITFTTYLVDVLVIDPRTNARFLKILNKLIDQNSHSSSSHSIVRMNSACEQTNLRLQNVYQKVAWFNRSKRIQCFVYGATYITMYTNHWWKYLGYNLAFLCMMFGAFSVSNQLLSLRKRAAKKITTKTRGATGVESSFVSAFKSTVASVAPE